MMEQYAPWQIVCAFLGVFSLGLAKAGIKGLSIITVTLLALVFESKASTGIVMPLLIIGDIFAVLYYHRHTQWSYLRRLLPWMVLGVIGGVWVGKDLPEDLFKRGMSSIILVSVIMMFWLEKRRRTTVPSTIFFGPGMGLAAGFTTMIGNLAGAFSDLYFLAMRLPKNEFIGTAAWLFLIINVFKLPFQIWVWKNIDLNSLRLDIYLLPALILGLISGIWLVKKLNEMLFRWLILILTTVGAIFIFFK